MALVYKTINLWAFRDNNVHILCFAGENLGKEIRFKLINSDGSVLKLSSADKINFYWHPEGYSQSNYIKGTVNTGESGVVSVPITKEICSVTGRISCVLEVNNSGMTTKFGSIDIEVVEGIGSVDVSKLNPAEYDLIMSMQGDIGLLQKKLNELALNNDPNVEIVEAKGTSPTLKSKLENYDTFAAFPNQTYNLIQNHVNFNNTNGWNVVNTGTLTASGALLTAVSESNLRIYADLEKSVPLNANASVLIKIRARCTSGGTATLKPCWRTGSSGVVIDKSYIIAGNVKTADMTWSVGSTFSDLWFIAKDGTAQATIDRIGLLISSGSTVEVAHFECYFSQDEGLTSGELEDLQADVNQSRVDIGNLQTDVNGAKDSAGLKTRMSAAEGNITALQKTVDGTETVAGLKTRMSSAEANITNLKETVNGAETVSGTVKYQIAKAKTDVINNSVNPLAERVTAAENNISANATDIAAEVTARKNADNSLGQRIGTAETNITQLKNRATTAESNISTNAKNISANATAISEAVTEIEKLQQSAIKKYSVSFSGSLSAGTRLDDAVGMRADVQIGTDASGVVNDFDNVSFFNRPICCCSWDTESRKWRVNAYEGEPGFTRDGSNGEVMYECTPFWYKADFEGEGAPRYISVTGTPCEGYTLAPMFKNGYDKVYCSSYWMSVVDGKATSRNGVYGTYGSLNSLMSNARTLDEKAHLETIEMLFSDYLLMLVEFATKDFQTVMLGASGMRYDSNDVITNIIYSDKLDVSNLTLNGVNKSMYAEGQTISVGSTKNSENHVANCKVLHVNGDESVCVLTVDTTDSKIAVGDYVSSRPWINGATDFITASSGTMANTGRYPCIWRGKVDPWGDAFSNICNLLIKRYGNGTDDSPYSYRLQYLPEPWKYTNGAITSDYIEANFDLATDNGYAKTLSADSRYPHLIGTTAIGASSTNYAAAYYYAPNGDIRTVRSGGLLTFGRRCSPVCFVCSSSPPDSGWSYHARLFCSP